MSDIIETIPLGEWYRIIVEYDEYAENPRGWTDNVGFIKRPGHGDSRRIDVEPVIDFPGDISRAIETYDREIIIRRWASVFHGITLEYDSTHGGWWFANPESVLAEPGSPAYKEQELSLIESERSTYESWCKGEVYGVILEHLTVWINADSPTESRETWEQVDSVWGNYLTNDFTAKDVAREFFAYILNTNEREALQ